MPQHTHQHGGLPPHDHDDPDVDHGHDDVVERERVVERDAEATAAVTVAPAPGGVAARIVLTILGAAAMIIGAFLSWVSGGESVPGVDIEFQVFYSTDVTGESGLVASAGFILIVLGLVALLGLAFRVGWLTSVAGALGLLAVVLYTVTLYRAGGSIGNLGIGVWVCAVGSLVTLIAGWFGARDRVVAVR